MMFWWDFFVFESEFWWLCWPKGFHNFWMKFIKISHSENLAKIRTQRRLPSSSRVFLPSSLYYILYYPGWRKQGARGTISWKFLQISKNITEAKLDNQLADFWTYRHLYSSTVLLSSFQQLSSSSSCCMMVPLLTVTMAFNVENNLKIVMTHFRVLLL